MNRDMNETKTVVILGASDKEERYANKAQRLLMEHGFHVVPVHPTLPSVEDVPVVHDLANIDPEPDVLTIYVRPETSSALAETILELHPRAIVFNPGTENPELEAKLADTDIRIIRACTIMLLTTGRFCDVTGIQSSLCSEIS
jgi:predicted CoA-binding protein